MKTLAPRVAVLGAAASKHGGWSNPRRGSRHERGYGSRWEQQRKRILARDCGLCLPCLHEGSVTPASIVDHRVPKFEGGGDDEANLQTICAPCHDAKTAAESLRGRGA